MASIPLFGPLRLAYRGQFVMLQDAGTAVQVKRYSLGLLL
jgi:hypothetical protein